MTTAPSRGHTRVVNPSGQRYDKVVKKKKQQSERKTSKKTKLNRHEKEKIQTETSEENVVLTKQIFLQRLQEQEDQRKPGVYFPVIIVITLIRTTIKVQRRWF